ncbi:PucR family transcriptional regulator ligand-binding domain-containing protein, partial [Micropruina sp.]|uniref:PucR family transcriptional regulator ligand-binding domain-containing protein n=1 Tax=Micropruina sp. TaxID=2737536 RepID=UPI0039E4DDF8
MAAVPKPTLRALLNRRDLGLRLATTEDELPPGVLDAPLRWVHGSDLADPTPFLTDDLLLLTTGTQFDGDDPDPYRSYVARLARRGVRGLGFGTEVVRDGIPDALLHACTDQRMPLFEVPYRTPFIALARANAEAVAAQAYARRSWALAAQRAISLAALQPDGLGATLAELARQLESWVGLFDATGTLVRDHPAGGLTPAALSEVTGEVGAMLRRGVRAGSSLEAAGASFTLQTLGPGGQLRGAIAIAAGGLDSESRGVVTSVIAMAGLALEQTVRLNQARQSLRSGLVRSLLTDDPSVAAPVVRELWTPLPPEPVVVAVATVPAARAQVASDWLERQSADHSVFHGPGPDGLVIAVADAEQALLDEFAALFE